MDVQFFQKENFLCNQSGYSNVIKTDNHPYFEGFLKKNCHI
jgi:hypothetical protein